MKVKSGARNKIHHPDRLETHGLPNKVSKMNRTELFQNWIEEFEKAIKKINAGIL
jgi:hypothetical protein